MRLLLIWFLLLSLAGTARADDLVWSSAYKNPWSSWDAYSYKRVEGQVRARTKAALEEKPGGNPTADPKVKHRSLKATDFKRAKAKGRPALDKYVASTGLTGAQADLLRTTLEGGILQIEAQKIRKNNVATSMAVLVAAATYVVKGVELDDAAQDRLTAELNDVLAADPAFRKLKAAGKQLVSDSMLTQASLILILAAAGKSDPGARTASEAAARGALQFLVGSETASAP